MRAPQSEKFAIVGLGCRLPPNANSLAAFWRFLLRGGNALRPLRADRYDWRQYFDEDPDRPGKSYAPKAATLDADVRQFDPLAFGISPREAASLDPQQRLLLEVAWEAFEDAGLPQERVAGSATGVFVGGFCLDHLVLAAQPANRHLANAHTPGGVMMTVLSNRLSHAFDLRGPSLTLDTACSSSLVAIHYACQSLRLRECDQVLAGGVNVMLRPEFPVIMSKGHFLSPHGECRAFDASAAGYARGEGAGLLLIKRLEDALAAGDAIHAVIRGTGVNQDGHTDGISLPNPGAQQALVRTVYEAAAVAPHEVDYVEAHGTGTQAGDPAELHALDAILGEGREPGRKLLVGSVKTNIGHLEAAAGFAGMLKAIGVLQARQVPRNLHFKTPNPRIPFDRYRLEVPTATRSLPPATEKPTLFVGVNSFGYGGTNAHVLLESAPNSTPAPASAPAEAALRLVPVSARSEEALRDLAGKFAFQLGAEAGVSLDDLAWTAAHRRSHLPVRGVAVVQSREELRDALIAASTGQPHEAIVAGLRPVRDAGRPVFVFTGMGPQWWGMGQELFREEPIAAAALEEIDALFAPLAGWSLKDAMLAPEAASRMAHTDLAQPANFALQVALVRLWEARGVRPSAVVGHSVGEVTAAHVAGVYSLAEAVRVSFHRSRLQQRMAGRGAMLAVGLPAPEAERRLAATPGVSIAAVNSFSAVTLSGDVDELRTLAAACEAEGIFHKFLRVEVAYHSPQMDPLRDDLLRALADLAPQPAALPLYSTAHGGIIPGEHWNADYWWHNVRHAVRFADAMQQAFVDGHAAFLEVGPHPVLANSIKECAATLGRAATCFPSLRRAEPERRRLALTLAELYVAGAGLDWTRLAPRAGRFVRGPQYPWQRQRHWLESERSEIERLGEPGPVYLYRPLPGVRPTWEVEVNRNFFPFLPDHGVQNQTVFAGLGYIEAALAAGGRVLDASAIGLDDVDFERVLVVDPTKIQVLVTEFDPETRRFAISSRVEGEERSAQRHCRGRLHPVLAREAPRLDLATLRAECPRTVTPEALYDDLRQRGLHYGPRFRPTTEVRTGDDCFLLRLDSGAGREEVDHPLHPTLFDAAIQPVIFCAREARLVVPSKFGRFRFFSRPDGNVCHAYGRLREQSASRIVADVWLTDDDGRVHAQVEGMVLEALDLGVTAPGADHIYRLDWKPAPLAAEPRDFDGSRLLVLADDAQDELAAALVEALPGARVARTRDEPRAVVLVLWGAVPADPLALNQRAVALLREIGDQPGELVFVTRDARAVLPGDRGANVAASSLGALALLARNELPALDARSVDVDGTATEAAQALAAELRGSGRGDAAWRGGERFAPSLERKDFSREPVPTGDVPLDEPLLLRTGRRDRGTFLRGDRREPGTGEAEVRVQRVCLANFDAAEVPAWEFAGVVVRVGAESAFAPGDRVVGIAPNPAVGTWVTLPEAWLASAPGVDASLMGLLAAERGLLDIAAVSPGERVLILRAASGLGPAAVRVAQAAGAVVLAPAVTGADRAALLELGVTHILGPDFAEALRGETVDVIYGAMEAGERLGALALLRDGGRCIHVGSREAGFDEDLPLRPLARNLVFAAVDPARWAVAQPARVQAAVRRGCARLSAGEWQPVPVREFPAENAADAFAAVAAGEPGTVVIALAAGVVPVPLRPPRPIRSDGCYIVTGGTAGFGLATARWLAGEGAGRILLASRSGPDAPGLAEALESLRGRAEVEAVAVDMTDPVQVRRLVERAGPTLRGIVHGAMVLDDALLADVAPERFARVLAPKVLGALHLVDALQDGPSLDFLVFSSSVSSLVGNRGQASYIAANAALDGLAHALRADGWPAISVNWGALAEAGVVARDERLGAALAAGGIQPMATATAFHALRSLLGGASPQVAVMDVNWPRWFEANPAVAEDPRFAVLRAQAAGGGGAGVADLVRAEFAASAPEERQEALVGRLQEVFAATLKMAPTDLARDRKLNELGVDSLMVLELGLGIEERLGVKFTAVELLNGSSLEQLAALARNKLWPSPGPGGSPTPSEEPTTLR